MGRPTGVTVIAVLDFIGAGIAVLAALGMMLGGGFVASMISQQQGAGAGVLAAIGAAAGIAFLFGAAIAILLGWGLLKLKEWARIITIVLAGLGALGALFAVLTHFFAIGMFGALCRLVINGLIIWYLLQPHVKAAFQGVQARAAGAQFETTELPLQIRKHRSNFASGWRSCLWHSPRIAQGLCHNLSFHTPRPNARTSHA